MPPNNSFYNFFFTTYLPSMWVINFVFLEINFMLIIISNNFIILFILNIFQFYYITNFCYESAKKIKKSGEANLKLNLVLAGG